MNNPYPDEWWNVDSVRYTSPIVLYRDIESVKTRTGEDADYMTYGDYPIEVVVDGAPRTIVVPSDFATDLASVPQWFRWIVSRAGTHLEASIVHDWLYVAWQEIDHKPRKIDREFADLVFLRAMEEARVGWLKRCIAYLAVRAFGSRIFFT